MISHIMFDIYHMSDPSESIMIMMVQKLRYDPTLGHNYLREFFLDMQPFYSMYYTRAYPF